MLSLVLSGSCCKTDLPVNEHCHIFQRRAHPFSQVLVTAENVCQDVATLMNVSRILRIELNPWLISLRTVSTLQVPAIGAV